MAVYGLLVEKSLFVCLFPDYTSYTSKGTTFMRIYRFKSSMTETQLTDRVKDFYFLTELIRLGRDCMVIDFRSEIMNDHHT